MKGVEFGWNIGIEIEFVSALIEYDLCGVLRNALKYYLINLICTEFYNDTDKCNNLYSMEHFKLIFVLNFI